MGDPSAHHIQLNMVVTNAPSAIQRCENDNNRQSMWQKSGGHGRH